MTLGVAILAAEATSALGDDLAATWAALLAGRSAVRPVRGFDARGFGHPEAAPIGDEPPPAEDDPALRILGRHGALLDRVVRRVHEAARLGERPRERLGLHVGLGMVDAAAEDLGPAVAASRVGGRLDDARFFAGAYRAIHPLWPLAMLNNVAVGQVSIDLDLRGDNAVLASAADGGARALLEGAWAVAEGAADAVVAGGASEAVGPPLLARLRLRGVLGDGPLRPASTDGRGTAPGEGAAAFAFAPTGAAPAGVFRGGASAFGAASGRPGPSRAAFARAAAGALRSAGWPADSVDAAFLHAEGSAGQDRDEAAALAEVLGPRARFVATKGALGHAGPAAAALDLAIALVALGEGLLPPSVRAEPPLPEVAGRLTATALEAPLARVLVVAAGVHGGVTVLAVEGAR